MITYICRNKDIKTGEDLPCTNTVCKTSICPSCGQRADAGSQLYWCKSCKTPIYEEVCPICNKKGKKLATDLRPVFPEERLLLELILGTPYAFLEKSVWNGSGNHYYVDGKRIPFSVKDLKQLNIDKVREEYQKYQEKNTDRYFKEQMEIFLQANRERYEALVEEADEYIRRVAADYNFMEMFVSFSGGKDSTVVSDLVMRALGNPKVLHIFGDTTLEFPFTYEYVKRFKQEHPQTPVITACNKEKDFEELCRMIGPPSRVMRWCCTIFKTGTIQKRIKRLKDIEKMEEDGVFENLPKKEVLQIRKEQERLEKFFGGIKEMRKLPNAVFVIDPRVEHNAVAEARKLNIPVFAIVDTNSDPDVVDYVIPANDDAVRSVKLITMVMADAVCEAKGGVLAVAYTKDEGEEISMNEVIKSSDKQAEARKLAKQQQQKEKEEKRAQMNRQNKKVNEKKETEVENVSTTKEEPKGE